MLAAASVLGGSWSALTSEARSRILEAAAELHLAPAVLGCNPPGIEGQGSHPSAPGICLNAVRWILPLQPKGQQAPIKWSGFEDVVFQPQRL